MEKKKAVVICSGGLDSTTLLYDMISRGYECHVLTFDYGQRHRKEIECAYNICKNLNIEFRLIRLPIEGLLNNSALVDTKKELPKEHYTHENQQQTVVSNRNMIMLSIAAGFADNIKAEIVCFGPHANDNVIYPDCRPEFVEVLNHAIILGTYNKPSLQAPYVNITKGGVVKKGIELKVPFEKTWSCYEGGENPCGKCGTCQERIEAFKENNMIDPLIYMEDETNGKV